MRKVLYIFATMPVGGAEILCHNVVRKLDRSKYMPSVCCISHKGTVGERIYRDGVNVTELGCMNNRQFDYRAVTGIADLIMGEDIDIIHTNMYHASLYGRLAVLLCRKPRPRIVVSHHSVYAKYKPHKLIINKLLNTYTDKIIAVSQPVRNCIMNSEKPRADKVAVLESIADIDGPDISMTRSEARTRLGLNEGDFVIGSVGRLVEEKGHRYLIEAVSSLKSELKGLNLIIAGAGKLEAELRYEADRLDVSDKVHFLGVRDDIPAIHRALDLFVMPSTSEAQGIALLEAMAAGVPCIVTSVGGMVDIAEGGDCAVVVPPRDPVALADAIRGFAVSEHMNGLYAEKSRIRAARFTFKDYIEDLQNLYDGLF